MPRLTALAACLALSLPAFAEEAVPVVEALRLAAPDAPVGETYFGTVRASDMAGLSYGARGCIVEISQSARDARRAEAGEVLVRLDDARSRMGLLTAEARVAELAAVVDERLLSVAAARADYDRRQQELVLTEEEFQRNSVMFGRGLINETAMDAVERRFLDAQFAFDRAGEAIATAEAARARADIQLEIGRLDQRTAEIDHGKLTLTAPFDGVLVGFEANVGDCVQEGERAAQIHAPDRKSIEIYFLISRLSEDGAGRLGTGQAVRFTRINGTVCGGTIARIDTEADLETQYVEATIDVDPACAPGLFLNEAVEVAPATGEADIFALPKSALTEGAVLMIDEATSELRAVPVEILAEAASLVRARVPGGAGRLVVADSAGLSDGQTVSVGAVAGN